MTSTKESKLELGLSVFHCKNCQIILSPDQFKPGDMCPNCKRILQDVLKPTKTARVELKRLGVMVKVDGFCDIT